MSYASISYYLGMASGIGASFAASCVTGALCKIEGLGRKQNIIMQGLATSAASHAIANFVVQHSPFWEGVSHGANFSTYSFSHCAARELCDEHLKTTVTGYQKLHSDQKFMSIKYRKERNFFTTMFVATKILSERYPSVMLNLAIATFLGYSVPISAYSEYKK